MTQNLGDALSDLPINKQHVPGPGELEFVYNIFQPKNKALIKQTVGVFSQALMGTALFTLLSLPFVVGIIGKLTKGSELYNRIILIAIFFIMFFLLDKFWLKK